MAAELPWRKLTVRRRMWLIRLAAVFWFADEREIASWLTGQAIVVTEIYA